MDIADIRNRAQGVKPGEVTTREIEYAREILSAAKGNISAALYVVGLCGEPTDARLVEPYLFGEERDVYGELALKILCRYMGLIDAYKDLLRALIMSDEDIGWQNSRMTAIHLADVYLEKLHDNAIGCKLLEIMMTENDQDRLSARFSLIEILGLRQILADPFAIEFDEFTEDLQIIIAAAQARFHCSAEAPIIH
ncbi:hypothetical protein [Rhizobium leguminosarum]|uniref:Uncharacterized protein n=1 Tax=Rhizobium leguminosarum TaxID=384 RepID=A0A2K9YYS2_RHILE|nr:hypothetical protein [Rhizobium leguminosarum]AUW41134.1 hypothetical protein CUJ84_Chr000727 [Rhizobium leguminosarum]